MRGTLGCPALAERPLRPLEGVYAHARGSGTGSAAKRASAALNPCHAASGEREGNPSHTCIDRRPEAAPTSPI